MGEEGYSKLRQFPGVDAVEPLNMSVAAYGEE
jgi:hypothetical protein